MQDVLLVVDMQNDFIDGALGSADAQAIVPKVAEKIKSFQGRVLCTRDTHDQEYLKTQEGVRLPVPHCVRDTHGWKLHPEIEGCVHETPIDKPAFGSIAVGQLLRAASKEEPIRSVTLVGLCTDICVISNAFLLKAFLPESEIIVDASCCAGVSRESHQTALDAMRACQITIIGE